MITLQIWGPRFDQHIWIKWYIFVIPALGSQPSPLDEFQVRDRDCLQMERQRQKEVGSPWGMTTEVSFLPPHIRSCTPAHTRDSPPTHLSQAQLVIPLPHCFIVSCVSRNQLTNITFFWSVNCPFSKYVKLCNFPGAVSVHQVESAWRMKMSQETSPLGTLAMLGLLFPGLGDMLCPC